MTLVSSVKFESAARAQETTEENLPGDDDGAQKSQNQSPPLASGRFVDCHAVRLRQQKNQSKSSDDNSEVAAVADAVEEAWRIVRHVYSEGKDSAVSIVPMLLSPLHRLRMYFSPHEQEQGAAVSPIIGDGVQALAKRLVACQVAEAAEQALKSEEGTSEDAAPAVTAATADDEWPYNPNMPTLLLVDSLCAAREERAGGDLRLVCNPQTPVRDWFRVLNHDLSNKNAPTRLLPLLTVEGTACGTQPVYCAVRVPQAEDYHDKHKELRQWGVDHSKDPGLQWQVLCDYTKIAIKDMQTRGIDFQIHPLVMSHDRSLRGVLVQNYTDADLRALRNKFGIRWLDEAA